jgi:hypothetical protein
MVVACIALFVALGGTSVAAINYARNAGAVDGKNAYAPSNSLRRVAGDLVATARTGDDRGQIPAKFLADVAGTQGFGRAFEVADNIPLSPVTVLVEPGIGALTATCADQSAQAGVEDPVSTITFANQSGIPLNAYVRQGVGDPTVTPLINGAGVSRTIRGANSFHFHIQHPNGTSVLIEGVVRQDGAVTPAASCLVYGASLRVAP